MLRQLDTPSRRYEFIGAYFNPKTPRGGNKMKTDVNAPKPCTTCKHLCVDEKIPVCKLSIPLGEMNCPKYIKKWG